VDERIHLAAFGLQIAERLADVTDLHRQAVFFVQLELGGTGSGADGVSADVDKHVRSPFVLAAAGGDAATLSAAIAAVKGVFSSEVGTGSREENTTNNKIRSKSFSIAT
jgi:hypothetical protein